MKKLFLSLSTLLLLSCAAKSQPILLGIRGGANLSGSNGPGFAEKYNFGWEIGPYVGFNLFKTIGLQTELLYSWTRLTTNGYSTPLNSIESGKKKLNYVSIPILVRVNVSSTFTFVGGPQLNKLADPGKYQLHDGKNAFKSSYTNWVAGFEFNSHNESKKATFYGRYNWGNGFENIPDGKNATITRFQLGVFMPILGNQ